MSRFVRNTNESGQTLCNKCPKILDNFNCEKNRYTCKECKKNQSQIKNLENKTKLITITQQTCVDCRLELSIDKFEKTPSNNFRKECKSCRYKTRTLKPTIPIEILRERERDKSKSCIKCGIIKKTIDSFAVHGNNYRNVCQDCVNRCEYWKKYRIQKRLIDEPGFIAHNTRVHKLWVENNLEHYQLYMQQYRKSLGGILAKYQSNSLYESLKNQFSDTTIYIDFMKEIISNDCFYCGAKHDEYYNGIDKIDANGGYFIENIVTCCSICNYMKNTMDIGSFLRKTREIAIFNRIKINLPQEYCNPLMYHKNISLIGGSQIFSDYKRRANKKNLIFNLSQELFRKLTKSSCYLCGLSNPNGIGVDRKDNYIGYTIENAFPCCSYCNYMKKCHSYNDFLLIIRQITIYSVNDIHDTLSKKFPPNRTCNLTL